MTSPESPTHPDAPRAGGETPEMRIDARLRDFQQACEAAAGFMDSSSQPAKDAAMWRAILRNELRASLLERHRDGERERLPAPSEIADLPAMTPIANVIRRSAYYVLNYHGATFASEKDAAGVAGHIAVSVTMANGFEDALHAAMSAPPYPERASK